MNGTDPFFIPLTMTALQDLLRKSCGAVTAVAARGVSLGVRPKVKLKCHSECSDKHRIPYELLPQHRLNRRHKTISAHRLLRRA